MEDRNRNIKDKARSVFDQSVARIDGATRSRLTQARHAAVAELRRPAFRPASWLPAAAAAAAAVLAVMLWTQPGPGSVPAPVLAAAPVDDFEWITLGEDLDLLDEDVEFYAWAASAEAGNGQG